MARKKKKDKAAAPAPAEQTEPNRYGAQGIYNETGVHCCCHMVPLSDDCYGCELLEKTKRQPTLWQTMGDGSMREEHRTQERADYLDAQPEDE